LSELRQSWAEIAAAPIDAQPNLQQAAA